MQPWPYKSSEDLAVAGYKCRGPIVCPHCGAAMVIYQIPGLIPVFLDPEKYFPHLENPQHADPPHVPMDGKTAATGDRI